MPLASRRPVGRDASQGGFANPPRGKCRQCKGCGKGHTKKIISESDCQEHFKHFKKDMKSDNKGPVGEAPLCNSLRLKARSRPLQEGQEVTCRGCN